MIYLQVWLKNEVLRETVRECKSLAGEGKDRWEMEQRKQLELRLEGKERRWEDSTKENPSVSEQSTENQD